MIELTIQEVAEEGSFNRDSGSFYFPVSPNISVLYNVSLVLCSVMLVYIIQLMYVYEHYFNCDNINKRFILACAYLHINTNGLESSPT